jgi:hypothetical protein
MPQTHLPRWPVPKVPQRTHGGRKARKIRRLARIMKAHKFFLSPPEFWNAPRSRRERIIRWLDAGAPS